MRRPSQLPAQLASALLAGLLPGLTGCVELSETIPTPQRPTVSSDTSTTRAGTLELEAGVDVDPDQAFVLPLTLKAGWNDTREVYVGWNAVEHYASGESPGANAPMTGVVEGAGDLYIGFRERFLSKPEAGATAAVQAEVKLPTAEDDVGTGEVDFRAALIGNRAWERVSLNGYYRLGILGDPDENGFDFEHAITVAVGGAIAGPLGAFAEVAGILRNQEDGEDDPDQLITTVGLQWALTPEIVLDLGAAVGLSDDAPDLRIVGGLTWNLGRFF